MTCHVRQPLMKSREAYVSLLCSYNLLQNAVYLLITYNFNQTDVYEDPLFKVLLFYVKAFA